MIYSQFPIFFAKTRVLVVDCETGCLFTCSPFCGLGLALDSGSSPLDYYTNRKVPKHFSKNVTRYLHLANYVCFRYSNSHQYSEIQTPVKDVQSTAKMFYYSKRCFKFCKHLEHVQKVCLEVSKHLFEIQTPVEDVLGCFNNFKHFE
jgi:hypothetical protein